VSTHAARRRRRRRTTLWVRVAALAVGGVLLFLLGIALGQALDDAPEQGTRTQVRTLRPLPLAPAQDTVTVTVTGTNP
jgi:type VI protein secretion system component VasF